MLRIVREVVGAPALGLSSDVAGVLEHQLQHLKRRALILVVSDFLDAGQRD